MTSLSRSLPIKLSLASVAFLLAMALPNVPAPKASAAYDGGRLIDNAAFLDANAMTAAQIQSFLQSKGGGIANMSFVLNCYGQDSKERQWYTAVGAPCDQSIPASSIIYYASQIYGINPKVVLATLQKEQSLITAPNPTSWQINQAMGYACPTSGQCGGNSTFPYQIDSGVWVLRYHYERANGNMSWWTQSSSWTCGTAKSLYTPNLYPGQNVNFIDQDGVLYRTLYLHNAASSSMYCYTPHTYNNPQGLYGLPAYGNVGRYYTGSYNFVKYYELWFEPSSTITNNVTMKIVSQPDATPARGQTVSYTVSYKNNAATNIVVDAIGIVGRAGSLSGANRDFGWQGPVTLAPGVTQEYTFTTIVKDTGMLYAWPAVSYQGAYVHYNNWGIAMNAHAPNLSLTTPLSASAPNPVAGQTVTMSATLRNNEEHAIDLSSIGIPIRYLGNYNYDTAWASVAGQIQPNATQAVSGPVTFDKPGAYSAWVSGTIAGQYTTLGSVLNFNVPVATPNFGLSYLEAPNPSPALGETVAVKFKLKNNSGVPMTLDAVGVVGRYDNPYTGANNDFGWAGPIAFTAGEEKSFTAFAHSVREVRNFYAWVALNYKGTYVHFNNWGFMMTPHLPNISASVPLTINSGVTPTIGQTVNVTATIKNNEAKPISYSALGIPARFYGVYNYDAIWSGGDGILDPDETVSLSGSIRFDKAGPYTVWNSILINGRYMTIGNPITLNL